MRVNKNAKEIWTDIPKCMTPEDIRCAPIDNDHVSTLFIYVKDDWPWTRAEVIKETQSCGSLKDGIAIIDEITIKGRRIIIPAFPQKRALEQLHNNHMGIQKT